MKQSGMLQKIKMKHEAEMYNSKLIVRQQAEDAAVITLHQTFGFGPDRILLFMAEFIDNLNDIDRRFLEDSKEDKGCDYTWEVIDKAVEEAMGKYFQPKEVRYDFTSKNMDKKSVKEEIIRCKR